MASLSPNSGKAVVELVRKAELADDDVLNAFVREAGSVLRTASDTATRLVEAGILTAFQARLILQGKYKGFKLGQYRLLDQIGAGGMGQVFLAEHVRLHRRVALKVLPRARAANPMDLERFYREARAVATLNHPNIVRAYDIDHFENLHFLVMEYLDGQTLLARLAEAGGVLSVPEACGYAIQVAAGLQHAHEKRIVHRDIHPGNLLLDHDGVVKILDMGIARLFHDDADSLTEKYNPGMVMGTADYIAPEQAMGSSTLDHRADIYSLGATLYHLVTGRPPFEGNTAAKLVAHQLHPVPPAHWVNPAVPEEVSAIIEAMMAKDPDERYQSAAEVIAALVPFAGGLDEFADSGAEMDPSADTQAEASRRKWKRIAIAALITLPILVAAIVLIAIL